MVCFLHFMNRTARKLYMKNSNFANPHGLINAKNYSTVEDMSKLCIKAWKLAKFRKICQTESHWGRIRLQCGLLKSLEWENTNILLQEDGFTGLKTGWTPAANACLTATYKNEKKGVTLLAVVFDCETKRSRFDDCRSLILWANQTFLEENVPEQKKV